jgi:hypothetical protein
MKPAILVLALVSAAVTAPALLGQAPSTHGDVFPGGANLTWGVGPVSLRDEYISRERYTGSLATLSARWGRFHERNGFRVEMELSSSPDVRSHHVSTQLTEFALDMDFLYPAGTLALGARRAFFFLGPSPGISLLVNDQQIASDGMEIALSFASLFTLGAAGEVVVPLSSRLLATGAVRTALFSAGLRMVDLVEEDEETALKLLGPLSGTRTLVWAGVLYRALDWVRVGIGYQGRLWRVTAWDPLVSSRDHLTFSLVLGR